MSPSASPPDDRPENPEAHAQEAERPVGAAQERRDDHGAEAEAEAEVRETSIDIPPPIIAIVGRPNVGKSTLLNALAGSRIAIVEPTPGVTRDRVGVVCTLAGRTVEIVDTGGVGIVDRQGLEEDVEGQVATAVRSADAVLFVVDAREGRQPLDERVAALLRPVSDKVLLIANKVESERVQWNIAEFQSLGYGEPMRISAKEKIYLSNIEERLEEMLPEGPTTPIRLPPPAMKIAVVGRVNAGKSTFVNAMVHAERMITSEVPGTTRDSVDIRFDRDGESLVLIDTAGIRKERRVHGSVEFYAQRRAEKAMRRADVTLLVIDSSTDVARLDRTIASYAANQYHPIVVVANKWDLCEAADVRAKEFKHYLEQVLRGLPYAPVVFTDALHGRNVERVLEVARRLFQQSSVRVPTAEINKLIERAYAMRKPRPKQGQLGRIYYASQVEVNPPTFAVFVNETYLFPPNYIRFLENRFREALPMAEVPIRIFLKKRDRSASKNLRGPKYKKGRTK